MISAKRMIKGGHVNRCLLLQGGRQGSELTESGWHVLLQDVSILLIPAFTPMFPYSSPVDHMYNALR